MPFERPTLTELTNRIVSDIETRATGGESLLRRSVLKILARVFAGAIHLLYGFLGYKAEQLFATTSDSDGLEIHSDEYGISRIAATFAIGTATVTGTTGLTVPEGRVLQTSLGEKYSVDSDVTLVAGTGIVELTAVEGGEDGNQDAGTTLTFVSPISGIDSTATVGSAGLVGGLEEETNNELKTRILRRKQFPPYGGCEYDIEHWMLEYNGVTRVWVFSGYNGVGTIGCAFVMDGTTHYIPEQTIMDLVKAYIIEHEDPITGRTVGLPVTAVEGLFMITLTKLIMNFSVEIYPNTSAIQDDIESELEDLIKREGGPGETIYLSDIQTALGSVENLEYFSIVSPAIDTTSLSTQVHTIGIVTFADYS